MIDKEVGRNYVSQERVIQLNMKVDIHHTPHYRDDENHSLNSQYNVHHKVGSYKENIQCDIVDIKKHLFSWSIKVKRVAGVL